MRDHGLAGLIQVFFQLIVPNMRVFLNESIEQLDRRIGVQRFITRRPGYDLAHAFHFVEKRGKFIKMAKLGKKLQPLGENRQIRLKFWQYLHPSQRPILAYSHIYPSSRHIS